MAKKLSPPSPESSLSPVAEDLIEQVESKVEVKTAANGRKRKATTTETKSTKRTKKATAVDFKKEETTAAGDEAPKPKGRAAKKMKVEEATVEETVKVEEDGEGKPKATKKKTTTRVKKQVDIAPLAERTQGGPLRAGAHVSIAGG
jgi:AP endonuclease-1